MDGVDGLKLASTRIVADSAPEFAGLGEELGLFDLLR
jgi:hypothetical protein